MDLSMLEETNRLREQMGMKPLPIPGQAPAEKKPGEEAPEEYDSSAQLEQRHAEAFENYKKIRDAEEAKRRREERAAAVIRAREKAQRNTVLAGPTLGEAEGATMLATVAAGAADAADDDARAWLRGQAKRQKRIQKAEEQQRQEDEARKEAAAARAEEAEAADAAARADGLKVAHDMSALLDGDSQILTLKDATILEEEDEGDELENIDLRERELLQERLELKKGRPAYDPLADDGEGEGGRAILSHYDEINGKKRKTFTLDSSIGLGSAGGAGSSGTLEAAFVMNGSGSGIAGAGASIDDILQGGPSSDYLDMSEIKVKKSKKGKNKAKKATRQRLLDDKDALFPAVAEARGEDGDGDKMVDVDAGGGSGGGRKRRADMDDIFREEDEIQAVLATRRREALKKRKLMRPEDVARQLREASEPASENNMGPDSDGEGGRTAGGGLVIDETAAFVSSLRRRDERDEDDDVARLRAKRRQRQQQASAAETVGGDVAMAEADDSEEDDDDSDDSEAGFPCPYHTMSPAFFGRSNALYEACDDRHESIASVLRHLQQPAHGLTVVGNRVSSFDADEEIQAGLCRKCWQQFSQRADFEAHASSPCAKKALSKAEKYRILAETFTMALPSSSSGGSLTLAAGLDEEKKVSAGMGATVALLRGRGLLAEAGGSNGGGGEESAAAMNARIRAHEQFLAEKKLRLAQLAEDARRQREQDRNSGPMSRMTAREREEYARKQNAQREFKASRIVQDLFQKQYVPSFKIEHVDEHGRVLDQKEAFRALSHGFHGKTSGRGKTDKMLKKLEAEKRRQAESILDASQSVGMSSATAAQLKKRKEAGVRLD